jgi:hypothetical protein
MFPTTRAERRLHQAFHIAVVLSLIVVASAAAQGGSSPGDEAAAAFPNSGFTCIADDTTLCLNSGRFQVRASYDDGRGNHGVAHMLPLPCNTVTPDTGYMWFFAPTNVEAVVKVIDGCGLGGHFWFFAGGLTNVDVVIIVTDSHNGAVKRYENPYNTAFQPIQDTGAFPCP